MKIKEKVLKEDFGVDDEVASEIVDSTLAEVDKVIDGIWSNEGKRIVYRNDCSMKEVKRVEELKQKIRLK